MELKLLKGFGLTEVEARVFSELIMLGSTRIGTLIERTGFHRGTIYNALQRLIDKGYVCFIEKDGKRHYSSSDISLLKEKLEERKKELFKERELIEEILKHKKLTKKEDITRYAKIELGHAAFKRFFRDLYEASKRLNKEYLFLGYGGEMQDEFGEKYYSMTQRLKKRMGVKCRVLLNEESKHHLYFKHVYGNIRFLSTKEKSPVNFWIYGDKTVIVLFGTKPLITITIEDKGVANSFRGYFETLWELKEAVFFNTREEYVGRLFQNLKENNLKEISKQVPLFFYPVKQEDFFKIRGIVKSKRETIGDSKREYQSYKIMNVYITALKRGKRHLLIQDENEIYLFFNLYKQVFGSKAAINKINEIKKMIKKYNLQIKTTKVIEPYINIQIFDDVVMVTSLYRNILAGFSTKNESVVSTYEKIFNKMFGDSKDVCACLNSLIGAFNEKSPR